MHTYEVGKPYIPSKTHWPEVAEYNYRGGSHELRMFLGGLSASEIREITKGPCEFALYVEGDIIFFLYRFGSAVPWSDAPYSWHLVPEGERVLPEPAQMREPHDLLNIVLVNADTGIVKGLRVITFSPSFTAAIRLAIHQQSERPWPGSEAYNKQVEQAYRRYSRTIDMLAKASARTKGGA